MIAQGITAAGGDKGAAKLLGGVGKLASTVSLAVDTKKAFTNPGGPTVGDVTKIVFEGALTFLPRAATKVSGPVAVVDLIVGITTGTSVGGRIAAGIDYSRKKNK